MKIGSLIQLYGRSLPGSGKKTAFFTPVEQLGGNRYLIKAFGKTFTARSESKLPLGKSIPVIREGNGWKLAQTLTTSERSSPSLSPFLQALGREGLPLAKDIKPSLRSLTKGLDEDRKKTRLLVRLMKDLGEDKESIIERLFFFLGQDNEPGQDGHSKENLEYLSLLNAASSSDWKIFPMVFRVDGEDQFVLVKFKKEQKAVKISFEIPLESESMSFLLSETGNTRILDVFLPEEQRDYVEKNRSWYENSLRENETPMVIRVHSISEHDGFDGLGDWSPRGIDEKV